MNSGLTSTQITELVTTYRDRCLWFLRHDYVPESSLEIRRTLDLRRLAAPRVSRDPSHTLPSARDSAGRGERSAGVPPVPLGRFAERDEVLLLR